MTKALALDAEPSSKPSREPGGRLAAPRRWYAAWRLFLGKRRLARGRPQHALRHLLAAARCGLPEAQLRLAQLYAKGSEAVFASPADALHWYCEAGQRGSVEAQYEASLLYLHGRQGPYKAWFDDALRRDPDAAERNAAALFPRGIEAKKSLKDALQWGLLAAKQGHVEAQANVGLQYLQGQGCEPNYEEALHWLQQAAAAGSAEAQYGMGMAYANGFGVTVDCTVASDWYEKAAAEGNQAAQVALGVLFAQGKGVERDARRAVELLRHAADSGNVRALHNLGLILLQGEGIERDLATAESCFRRATRRNFVPSILSLAEMYAKGLGAVPNLEESLLLYKHAANLGSVEAQYNLGYLYSQEGKFSRRAAEAVIWYSRAAQRDYPPAQFRLGTCYLEGAGINRDMDKAVEWLERAADNNFVPAELALAELHLSGSYVPSNPENGLRWLRKAADSNDAEAQFRLGTVFSTGRSVPRDIRAAVHWYRLAAEQGHRFAQHNLGDLLLARGRQADLAEAAVWFGKAAEQGLADSQLAIGDLLASGRGVPRDLETARHWYKRAASLGLEEAKARLAPVAPAPATDAENPPALAAAPADAEEIPPTAEPELQSPPPPDTGRAEARVPEGRSAERVRLVIWGLDDTFWLGALANGDIRTYVRDNHEMVITLAQRGIVSSVCARNDPDRARAILQQNGIWDYFVYPSIDTTAVTDRIASVIRMAELNARSVLYIDSDAANREEVQALLPAIQVADATILSRLLADPRLQGESDQHLRTLAQYKFVEKQSRADRDVAALRAANIRIAIENDIAANLDRTIELINGADELNFTRRRLPEDLDTARRQLLEEIAPYYVSCGLVRVLDDNGDYGYCGFYRMASSMLLDFCFSSRIRGMGVEAWLYERLGRPELVVDEGDPPDISELPPVDWVTPVAKRGFLFDQPIPPIPQVRLRGGFVLEAMEHYLRIAADSLRAETSLHRDPILLQTECSALLAPLVGDVPPDFHDEAERIGYSRQDLASEFLAPAAPGTVLLYSPWGDLSVPVYRHKTKGIQFPVSIDIYNDLTAMSDDELGAVLDEAAGDKDRIREIAAALRMDYEYAEQLPVADAAALFEKLFNSIPGGARLFVLLPYEYLRWNDTLDARPSVVEYNAVIRALARGKSSVTLVELNHVVLRPEDIQAGFDQFEPIVYFRLYEHIMGEIRRTLSDAH